MVETFYVGRKNMKHDISQKQQPSQIDESLPTILVVGYFAFALNESKGQAVKTQEVFYALQAAYGKDSLNYLDTYGWKKNPLKLFLQFFTLSRTVQNVIMLPAHNGLNVFSILLLLAKMLFGCHIYYDVIGGWITNRTASNRILKNILMRFDGIWVETKKLEQDFLNQGFLNISIVPNFKNVPLVDPQTLPTDMKLPLRLCTFSRVMEEKGIVDAIRAVELINDANDVTLFTLDIWGWVDDKFQDQFNTLQARFPSTIRYRGNAKAGDSTAILSQYDILLFPTHYVTEGIPGTIIDAYASGVPVVASRWQSFSDIIDDGITGYGFTLGDVQELVDILNKIVLNPNILLPMKQSCLEKATEFLPQNAVKAITAAFSKR